MLIHITEDIRYTFHTTSHTIKQSQRHKLNSTSNSFWPRASNIIKTKILVQVLFCKFYDTLIIAFLQNTSRAKMIAKDIYWISLRIVTIGFLVISGEQKLLNSLQLAQEQKRNLSAIPKALDPIIYQHVELIYSTLYKV